VVIRSHPPPAPEGGYAEGEPEQDEVEAVAQLMRQRLV
jgi:hypothetical protein